MEYILYVLFQTIINPGIPILILSLIVGTVSAFVFYLFDKEELQQKGIKVTKIISRDIKSTFVFWFISILLMRFNFNYLIPVAMVLLTYALVDKKINKAYNIDSSHSFYVTIAIRLLIICVLGFAFYSISSADVVTPKVPSFNNNDIFSIDKRYGFLKEGDQYYPGNQSHGWGDKSFYYRTNAWYMPRLILEIIYSTILVAIIIYSLKKIFSNVEMKDEKRLNKALSVIIVLYVVFLAYLFYRVSRVKNHEWNEMRQC